MSLLIFDDPNRNRPCTIEFGNVLVITSGTQENTLFDGNSSRRLGIERQAVPSVATPGGTLDAVNGDEYKVVRFNSHLNTFSAPSPATTHTGPLTNTDVTLTMINPADTRPSDIYHIFRSDDLAAGNIGEYYFIGQVVVGTGANAVFTNVAADILEFTSPLDPSGVPDPAAYCAEFNNRLWLGGDHVIEGDFDYTNGSDSVVASDAATANKLTDAVIGKRIRNRDQSERSFEITARVGGTLTIDADYEGATQTSADSSIIGPLSSSVQFSTPGHVENFPVDGDDLVATHLLVNEIAVKPDDGQPITALKSFQDRKLLVYKTHSIYQITGTSVLNFRVDDVTKEVGTPSFDSVVEYGGRIYFYDGFEGIWTLTFDGTRDVLQYISIPVRKTFRDDVDHSRDAEAVAIVFQGFYILSLTGTGGTYNDLHIVYDIEQNVWTTFRTRDINALGVVTQSGVRRLWAGDTLGRVYDAFVQDQAFDYFSETGTVDSQVNGVDDNNAALTNSRIGDSGASFNTTGDGMRGAFAQGTDSTGATERIRILRNTSATFDVETAPALTWVSYAVGAIPTTIKTKRYDFAGHRMARLQRLHVSHRQQSSTSNMGVNIYRDGAAVANVPDTSPRDMSVDQYSTVPVRMHGSQFEVELTTDAPGHAVEYRYMELDVFTSARVGQRA